MSRSSGKPPLWRPAPRDRSHLLDVVGRRDVHRAARQLAVDGLHHRIAHDAVEPGGSAQGVVDPPDAAGLRGWGAGRGGAPPSRTGAPGRTSPGPGNSWRPRAGCRSRSRRGSPEARRCRRGTPPPPPRRSGPFRTMYPRRSNSYFCSGVRAKAESVEVIFRVLLFAARAGDGVRPVAAQGQEVQRFALRVRIVGTRRCPTGRILLRRARSDRVHWSRYPHLLAGRWPGR